MSTSLKDQNRKWLWAFVSVNAICFPLVLPGVSEDVGWWEAVLRTVTSKASLYAVVPLATLVLSNLVPSPWKACLVFWRIKNPLPGSRVFTDLAKKDPRIDMQRIRAGVGGNLPRAAQKQNALWYQIYKKHQEKPIVMTAHRDFLLTRDLATMSLLMGVSLALLYVFHPGVNTGAAQLYFAILMGFFLLMTIVARNLGNRFTLNVLAEESVECVALHANSDT